MVREEVVAGIRRQALLWQARLVASLAQRGLVKNGRGRRLGGGRGGPVGGEEDASSREMQIWCVYKLFFFPFDSTSTIFLVWSTDHVFLGFNHIHLLI